MMYSTNASSKAGLPHLGSPTERYKKNLDRLNQTFSNENVINFSPPNISAFRKGEMGRSGSLWNAKNEKINKTIEANVVESRVKLLKKEEDRMLKKIEEARR